MGKLFDCRRCSEYPDYYCDDCCDEAGEKVIAAAEAQYDRNEDDCEALFAAVKIMREVLATRDLQ